MSEISIIVPCHLHDRLKRLAEISQETNGVFLYTPKVIKGRTSWKVHGFLLTGRGNAVHVEAHPNRARVVDLVLQHLRQQDASANLGFIKVHTHCRATGREWFDKFSQGDHESVQRHLSDNPNYTLMMYSPTHHLATGHPQKRYNVRVVDSTPEHRRNSLNLERLAERLQRQHRIPPVIFGATERSERR